MTNQAILGVILGPDNSQRVVISAGLPSSVAALEAEIKTQCKIVTPFRLQFMDPLFGNDFVNLTSIEELQDKATLKVVYTVSQPQDQADSFSFPSTSAADDASSSSGDSTVILASPEYTSSRSSWPDLFPVPRFKFDAEIKLEKAYVAFKENGMLLIPDPKLKSDILEGLIQEVVKHTVYLTDSKFDQVAEALILRHPCLKEKGSPSGYAGWKMSLKYKLSNYRTHLRKVGCPEVCANALKYKPAEKCSPAYDVKRPKRGEVDYCPPFPLGVSEQSLEKIRIELLSDVKKRNNRDTIKGKMNITFSLRRQEVIYDAPMISELQQRWPALFDAAEHEHFCIQKISLKKQSSMNVFFAQDMTDAATLSAIAGTTVGVYVTRGTPGKDFPDVGIIIEGVVILQDLDNVALATAMLFGLFYCFNMSYPAQLRYTFEVIQKVVMGLDPTELSRKAQNLKTKLQ
uniref:PB1 domain-containing protein n=1 Tax=Oryzias melastigma TaxID=30732 RepID=A0A3B3DHK9_ORYME